MAKTEKKVETIDIFSDAEKILIKANKQRRAKIKKEAKKIKEIYILSEESNSVFAEKLIISAATLNVFITECEDDVIENGKTEMFSQSPNTKPYERERPIIKTLNTFLKSRNEIIKTLEALLERTPAPTAGETRDEFDSF